MRSVLQPAVRSSVVLEHAASRAASSRAETRGSGAGSIAGGFRQMEHGKHRREHGPARHCSGGRRAPGRAAVGRPGRASYNGAMFVHLRMHTEFSVVDGTNRIDEVARAAAADGQPALAITDLNNLFGAVKFYKATRSQGGKPIVGAEIFLPRPAGAAPASLIVLVQSPQGCVTLSERRTRAWTRGVVKNQGMCRLTWLEELAKELIALPGAQAGAMR